MHDMASRLAGRGVRGDQIRNTKDRDVLRLQPLLHRRRHVADWQVRWDEDPPLFVLRRCPSSNQQNTTAGRGANLLTLENTKQEAVLYQLGQWHCSEVFILNLATWIIPIALYLWNWRRYSRKRWCRKRRPLEQCSWSVAVLGITNTRWKKRWREFLSASGGSQIGRRCQHSNTTDTQTTPSNGQWRLVPYGVSDIIIQWLLLLVLLLLLYY